MGFDAIVTRAGVWWDVMAYVPTEAGGSVPVSENRESCGSPFFHGIKGARALLKDNSPIGKAVRCQ